MAFNTAAMSGSATTQTYNTKLQHQHKTSTQDNNSTANTVKPFALGLCTTAVV
jgi:hypothetical protein